MRHRHALRAGDAPGVARTLDSSARRPAERDLLVDLVAAEGLERATRRLARFWRVARTDVASVRLVDVEEAEVYETLSLAEGTELDIVTQVRLGRDGTWRVVSARRAPADLLRIQVRADPPATPTGEEFTARFQERHGATGELVFDGAEGVLGHPTEEWVGAVHSPTGPGGAYEVLLAPEPDLETRVRQARWVVRAALVLAEMLGAERVAFPAAPKLVSVEMLERAGEEEAPTGTLLVAWVALHRVGDQCFTGGMSAFGLPELTATADEWRSLGIARQVTGAAARSAVAGALSLCPGEVAVLAGRRATLGRGPRGPHDGRSFGRFGSIEVLPLRGGPVTHSGIVERT